ncbi:MAG: AAA family ATPase, partial [Proteobacteria bacterium]|nr:AAA family ATPase [Pseudomonadota bacterium]
MGRTTADVVQALTRTAMAGGARPLAKWLAELDATVVAPGLRPSWRPEVTSISVSAATETPPPRPSGRSITQSLANVPAQLADFGTGTPGWRRVASPEGDFGTHSIERDLPGLPFEPDRGVPQTDQFERPSSTDILPKPRFPTELTVTKALDPWAPHRATTGLARLANLMPEPRTLDTELPALPSRPTPIPSEFNVATSPAVPRFDHADEVTSHGRTIDRPERGLGEATSYDELAIEASLDRSLERSSSAEDPIDDDLGAMAAGVLAERRRSVVVAAVLEGGDADLRRTVTASLGSLAYQRGAVVIAQDDTSLIVAFGLEVAGEDDVAVAMGWALDAGALARDASVADDDQGTIALRIGARTGVATSTGRDSMSTIPPVATVHTTPDPTGPRIPADAIDEARALAREATPDRPLFLGTTGRVTSALYTLREVPTPRRAVRGRSKAIEVIGPRGFEERDRARLERRGKLFGRSRQLAELESWLGRAIAANRRLAILVTGAAGTGKSRLVAELVARRGAELRVVSISASPASRFAPFALVIDLYQAALGLPPARGRHARAQVTQRLAQWMTSAGTKPDRARAVATDLDRAMELRDGVGVAAPEVADLRPRISAGLAAFRAVMANGDRPLVTIIEDIHHVDGASLEVLRHTLAVPATGPELLVMTARLDGLDGELQPPPVDVVVTVGDLVGGELRALIADRLGDVATPFNIATVLARGGGNPLFVEELAQAVREAGGDVPASARDVVAARLDRLGAKAKAALRFAAVIGGTVRTRILEELLGDGGRSPGGEVTHELEDELDELVESGLLVRPESAAHSTEGELSFARGLVREVVYESMSARAQRESHARVGRLLASRFFAGRDEPPGVIAEHLEHGGELAAAAAFWLRAGRLALRASDAEGAVVHFSRTLTLERDLGGRTALHGPTPPSKIRRREALLGREEARRLLGDLSSDPGDLDELVQLCEGQPLRLADVAIRRAQRMLRLGDFANAHVATVVAEDHAIAGGDDRARGEALRVRGEVLERIGRFDEALAAVGTARELFHRRGAIHEEMAAMIGRGRIHLMRAHYEAARDAYTPVLALIDQTGDPWLERIAKNHVAVIDMCLGNFAQAMAAARRSLDLCRRYGDRAREGDALSVAAIILLEVGLHDEAAEMFDGALE